MTSPASTPQMGAQVEDGGGDNPLPAERCGLWKPLELERVVELKRRHGHRVAVVLPTLDEERTIGGILDAWRPLHGDVGLDMGLIDELVVIDSGSVDGTRHEVERRGVRFVSTPTSIQRYPALARDIRSLGKGTNMWLAQHHTSSDILVFADSDMENPRQETISRILSPLVTEPEIMLVKSIFKRDTHIGHHDGQGGGRVTRLTANPLLQVLFPELATIAQPLNGNIAIRRSAMEVIPFGNGCQVDIEILINVAMRSGRGAIAQVHCGSFEQEGNSLDQLERVAHQIARTIIHMAADHGRIHLDIGQLDHFVQASVTRDHELGYERHGFETGALPRALDIEPYRERFATHVIALRHAPTEYNIQGRIQGWQDTEVIPELVRSHIEEIGADQIVVCPDVIVTSGLERAKATARALVTMHRWDSIPVIEEARLNERDWGELTGKTRAEARATYPDIDVQIDSPDFTPDGSESHAELTLRVEEALCHLRDIYPGRTVLIVTHKGTLGAMGLRHDRVDHATIVRDSNGYFVTTDDGVREIHRERQGQRGRATAWPRAGRSAGSMGAPDMLS